MTIDTRDYDLATYYRFKLFFDNCHWYNRPNIPITEIRNNHIFNGKRIEFPLVALRRVATPVMYKDGQNSWATVRTGDRRGRDITIAPDMSHATADMTMVHSCYELRYMLEVFSFERDNFDELNIELQENLFRYPYLTFENWKNKDLRMPDPQVSGMSTNILWESTEDNTDLESFDSQTPFYRSTITFSLRAYIYRKYAALLLEELLSGYRILDYNKVTQQIVKDESLEFDASEYNPQPDPPEPPDPPTPPGPEPPEPPIPPDPPTGTILTTDNVADFNKVGSMGMFLYTELGDTLSYGSEINGRFLMPFGTTLSRNGEFSYTSYSKTLSGKWKLLSVAQKRTVTEPCIVFAIKVDDSFSNTSNNTDSNNTDSNNTGTNNTDSNNTGTNNTDSNNSDSNNINSNNTDSNNLDTDSNNLDTGTNNTDTGTNNTDTGTNNTDTNISNTNSNMSNTEFYTTNTGSIKPKDLFGFNNSSNSTQQAEQTQSNLLDTFFGSNKKSNSVISTDFWSL